MAHLKKTDRKKEIRKRKKERNKLIGERKNVVKTDRVVCLYDIKDENMCTMVEWGFVCVVGMYR